MEVGLATALPILGKLPRKRGLPMKGRAVSSADNCQGLETASGAGSAEGLPHPLSPSLQVGQVFMSPGHSQEVEDVMLVIFRGLCGAWHRGLTTGDPTGFPIMWYRWLCKAWPLPSSVCAPFKAAIPDAQRH